MTSASTTKNLAANITVNVTQGTGGSFGSCTGYTPLATGSSVYIGTPPTSAPTPPATPPASAGGPRPGSPPAAGRDTDLPVT